FSNVLARAPAPPSVTVPKAGDVALFQLKKPIAVPFVPAAVDSWKRLPVIETALVLNGRLFVPGTAVFTSMCRKLVAAGAGVNSLFVMLTLTDAPEKMPTV